MPSAVEPMNKRERHALARASVMIACAVSITVLDQRCAFAADAASNGVVDSATERRTSAKAKYEEGVEAYRGARYAEAVRLFLEADALSPSAALSYNIARAYEKLADDAQTLRWYRNYLRLSPQASNAAEVEGYVRSLSRALSKQRIQQVTILSTPPGARVAIDGNPLGVTPLTTELRPGKHRASLSLGGFADFEAEFELTSSTPLDVNVGLERQKDASRGQPALDDQGKRRFGVVPYVTLGVAAACLGGAAIFEVSRRSAQNSAKNENVQLDYERDIDAMQSRQTTARVLLGVGGVLAVTGATLLVFNTRLTPDSRALVAGVPGGATFSLEQRF